MKKLFTLLAIALIAIGAVAQDEVEAQSEPQGSGNKMAFVVGGPEKSYNQIKVVNHTALPEFQCRVCRLNEDNSIKTVYGFYNLKGYDDTDSNTDKVKRGERIGIQMPNDFPVEVTFSVEYIDRPFYDAIVIYVNGEHPNYEETF